MFARYMENIIREIKKEDTKLNKINNLHESIKFTMKNEVNEGLPVLDLKLMNESDSFSSTRYSKPTETGLIMN